MDLWALPESAMFMFELVSGDDGVRAHTLRRHAKYVEKYRESAARAFAIWSSASETWLPRDPALAAAMDQASAAADDALSHTVQGVVGHFLAACSAIESPDGHRQMLGKYAILFLLWEQKYPFEWRGAGPFSPWQIKRKVLRAFAEGEILASERPELFNLTIAAVLRPNRCEDSGYAKLVRRLDSASLRQSLFEVARAGAFPQSLRARYLIWVIEDPNRPITTASWHSWLRADVE